MWLLPTLNRIDKLKQFLASAIECESTLPGLIVVDKADYEEQKEAYDYLEMPTSWDIEITTARSMGDKCRELSSMFMDKDWVGILNDDHIIRTKAWDQIMVSRLNGKNFVSANDRSQRTFMMPVTATAWSTPLLRAIDWPIYPPSLQHLFIDNIWRDLGAATGSWLIAANVVVEHHHVIFGQARADDTHAKIYNQRSWDMDNAVYQNFLKHDFALAIKKISEFQDIQPGELYNPEFKKPPFYHADLKEGQ